MGKDLTPTIVAWAKQELAIRTAILLGSRANITGPNRVDEYSDSDVALFVTDHANYTTDDTWMQKIGYVAVYIPETIYIDGISYPVRLIIFKDGSKADIAFYPVTLLDQLAHSNQLPEMFNFGYKVLIDKDGNAKNLRPATGKAPCTPKPSEQEFLDAINVFFFEACHVAKYLQRNDLWHAKFRDWTTKEYLLRMIEWHEKATHDWNYDTICHGKRMQSWIRKETWDTSQHTFGHFDANDSMKALLATIELFRNIAKETASMLGYVYPIHVDESVTKLISQ